MEQLDLMQWPGARRSDPETSHAAADSAAKRASHGKLTALMHLVDGAKTDFELAAETGMLATSIGKRRCDCVKEGWVEVARDENGAKITRPSPTDSPALVWKITSAGRKVFAEASHADD